MSDDDLVNSFTERLHYFENGGNIDELLALFSEDAELGDLTRSQPLHGRREQRIFGRVTARHSARFARRLPVP